MSEFKFTCPKCKQRMAGSKDWVGREMTCPTCKTQFAIPAPPATPPKKATRAIPSPKSTEAPISVGAAITAPTPTKAPARSSKSAPTPAPAPTSTGEAPKPDDSTAPDSTQARVAVLSPEIKLDIVQEVKRQVSDKTRWIPGVTKSGEYIYAASSASGKDNLVEPTSPEATHFSLMGAFLRELAIRDVARNAQGRRRMLDQEIPGAIKKVLASDEEPDREISLKELLSISHSQCLEALDILEERYRTKNLQAKTEEASKKFGRIRLRDLLKRLEAKARVHPDDIVIALYYELQEVRGRLEKLEKASGVDSDEQEE